MAKGACWWTTKERGREEEYEPTKVQYRTAQNTVGACTTDEIRPNKFCNEAQVRHIEKG